MKCPVGKTYPAANPTMKLAMSLLVFCLSAVCAIPEVYFGGQWKVEVAGLRVIAPAPGGKDELRAFNYPAGVTIALRVTAPEGLVVVDVLWDKSRITSVMDDKGTDLVGKREDCRPDFEMWFNHDDRAEKQVEVEATTSGLPSKGATGIKMSGRILMNVASATETLSAEKVALKKGGKFKLGGTDFLVSRAENKEGSYVVVLEAKGNRESFSNIEFQDSRGQIIQSSKQGWEEDLVTGMFRLNCHLVKEAQQVKIVATKWTDLRTIEVPFAVETGLGL